MENTDWKNQPDEADFGAARTYLSLLVEPSEAKALAKALEHDEQIVRYRAVDLLRASGLPLTDAENPEVARDLSKVKFGTRLSPVLLVRGEPLVIADGYHRVCASVHLGAHETVPCRIVTRRT